MDNNEILNYVMKTPANTNRRILNSMLNQLNNGGGMPKHGVFFIDYDGSIIATWASNEVASKTALPDNPTHDGLVAQGWNWDLQHIKDYIATYENADVYVGQMYETASGLTEIDITVTKVTGLTVTCNMVGNKNWGDGIEDALTEHTYTDYGDYTITCDGTSIPAGADSSGGLFDSLEDNNNGFWCTAIRIGGNVVSIEEYSLYFCCSLTNITISQSVTSIGEGAFSNCSTLIYITIPQDIENIGEWCFIGCYSLTGIAISQSVINIGEDAFFDCYSLTDITIPQNVTNIREGTFTNCYSLTNVTIPRNVINIGESAFSDCSTLTNVTIPQSVTNIGERAFVNCQALTSINLPQGIENIGTWCFGHCHVLTNITIPQNVTNIGEYAFYFCYTLTDITIPQNIENIGKYAFGNCHVLTNITIPQNVTNIREGTFTNCYSLTRYDFTAMTSIPTLVDTSVFNSLNGICKIIVPDALYDTWIQEENWSTYADYIYKASEMA